MKAASRFTPRHAWQYQPLRCLLLALLLACSGSAHAIPVYARQTGQNCLACHAGGQFPELTPYGRYFKMTGYTIGTRTVPLSVMGLASVSKVANTTKSDQPSQDFQKEGQPIFATGSLFLAGRISDNFGAFVQITYDNYASQGQDGSFRGYTQADNMDLRYADHLIDEQHDLIYGVSLNNNPSITDPWNTAAAWMQYVPVPSPTSSQFIDGAAPYPGFGAGGNLAGATAYLFWNRTLYLEAGSYRTANQAFSVFSFNIPDAGTTHLSGNWNPYWRVALSHEWDAHNLMVGTSGMSARVYDGGSDVNDPRNLGSVHNAGLDAQYQYLLAPHTVTAQIAWMRQISNASANTLAGSAPYFQADGVTPVAPFNSSDTLDVLRAKLSYVYRASYGGAAGLFRSSGSTNTLAQSSGYDSNGQITSTDPMGTGIASTRVTGNLSGNPATRGYTLELFWLPIQNVRAGVQYTAYTAYNGAGSNYDGFGRNGSDNNSLFLYLWGAY